MLFSLAWFALASFIFLGAQCNQVRVPNTRVYAVEGKLRAGAGWVETLSSAEGEVTMQEFIKFLEAQPPSIDPATGETIPGRGAAFCQSASDFNKQKTALEQLCAILKKQCVYELKKMIETLNKNMDNLKRKSQLPETEK